ncbi:unnamed protein product [Caenorhabditis bovis]|uniref:Activin_recp domain-containing protein n=1 Tax=Caenorhabditis bovis TaxID=2654633 RepID=A0A8S1EX36_9PELO|nr:unnamed protein product [Caenorhabditis bovis]
MQLLFLRVFILSGFIFYGFVALKCYEGSRGIVNGEDSKNFVENLCDENMQYCFESYNTNLTEVTASCQSMGTDPKLLEVCKMDGMCKNRTDIDVTVCCCTTDLCNLQDDLKPTPETPSDVDNMTSAERFLENTNSTNDS